MAGKGLPPKDPERRARRNADPVAGTVLPFQKARQPALPAGVSWPRQTRTWWAMWGKSAQAALMTATDWSFLQDTALIHKAFWEGDLTVAGELRLRVAKFGATLEDRARLRITFAEADAGDRARPKGDQPARPSARERRGVLLALPSAPAASDE